MHSVNTIPDKKLVEQIQAGNTRSYYLLFNRYWEELYRIAQNLLKDPELSKDILQDIWLSFWEKRKQINNQNIRAYLIQAVKFRVYKEWRDGQIPKEYETYLAELPAPDSIASEVIEQQELEEQVNNWIEELPAKCQKVFRLSRFNDLSNQEIAQKLNLSTRTVETHISHALKHLRKKRNAFLWVLALSQFC